MSDNLCTRISWWNTGITPPILSGGKSKRDLEEVVEVLEAMVAQGTRIFGLCEISYNDITEVRFQKFLIENGFKWRSFYRLDGRAIWDLAFIYDGSIFEFTDFAYIPATILGRHKKLAVKIDGSLFGHQLRIFLSHFPGIRTPETTRMNMFTELVTRIHTDADFCSHTVAMGDYNIEVCASGVLAHIARSRKYAISENKLYTPFVRHIGEKYEKHAPRDVSGTIRIKGKWEFYDYITVTRHFYHSDSIFHVNDFRCGIWDELFEASKQLSDHLPVYITISSEAKQNG